MSLRIFFILIVTTVVGMQAFPQQRRSGESPGKIYCQVLMTICEKFMRAVPRNDL